jgi:AcrR family transcriptional regulator
MPTNKTPIRKRGQNTRARLVKAAVRVFERDGFLNARVADIAAAAGVAHGSFYTYFNSKEDVFREIVDEVVNDVYAALDAQDDGTSAPERIRALNRRYVELYEDHAAMLGLIEQVGTLAEFHSLRRDLRSRFVERIEQTIRTLKDGGETTVEPLDPHVMANALAGMLDNFAYTWFVLKEPFDKPAALENLEAIWLRTLALDGVEAAAPRPAAARGRTRSSTAKPAAAKAQPAKPSQAGRAAAAKAQPAKPSQSERAAAKSAPTRTAAPKRVPARTQPSGSAKRKG